MSPHHRIGRALQCSLLAALALLTACASNPTKIVSNKADNYTLQPKRVFLITDVGDEFGPEFYNSFYSALDRLVRNCGAEFTSAKINPLQLDDSAYAARIKSFNPDVVLSIRRNGGTRSNGVIIHAIYDARFIQTDIDKVVWRSVINFYGGYPQKPRAETLAVEITNKMKADQLFTRSASCKPIEVLPSGVRENAIPPLPASLPVAAAAAPVPSVSAAAPVTPPSTAASAPNLPTANNPLDLAALQGTWNGNLKCGPFIGKGTVREPAPWSARTLITVKGSRVTMSRGSNSYSETSSGDITTGNAASLQGEGRSLTGEGNPWTIKINGSFATNGPTPQFTADAQLFSQQGTVARNCTVSASKAAE